MKDLILVRHAKSDWSHMLGDRHRPLKDSGRSDAGLVAKEAVSTIPKDIAIWCSPAERTTQTAKIFSRVIGYPENDIIFREALYTFDLSQLENEIRHCGNDINSLMVFCHNEAVTDFVNKFGDIYIDNVPTSGLTYITFDTNDWRTIGRGKVRKVILPRDLRP